MKKCPYKETQKYPGVICCCQHQVSLEFLMFGLKPMKESNLFAKLDISGVKRFLRASNFTSSSLGFEKCSVSLISGLSLEMPIWIWGVISLKVRFSNEISILVTT